MLQTQGLCHHKEVERSNHRPRKRAPSPSQPACLIGSQLFETSTGGGVGPGKWQQRPCLHPYSYSWGGKGRAWGPHSPSSGWSWGPCSVGPSVAVRGNAGFASNALTGRLMARWGGKETEQGGGQALRLIPPVCRTLYLRHPVSPSGAPGVTEVIPTGNAGDTFGGGLRAGAEMRGLPAAGGPPEAGGEVH